MDLREPRLTGSAFIPAARREKLRRGGVFPALIGSSHVVRGKDGKQRQYTVAARSVVIAEAAKENRKLTMRVVDLLTGREFDSVEALRGMFPDEASLKMNEEPHVYAWFCPDPQDPEHGAKLAEIEKEITARKKLIEKLTSNLDKLENPEDFDQAKARIGVQRLRLEDSEKERTKLTETVIGLLSDELPTDPNAPSPPQAA